MPHAAPIDEYTLLCEHCGYPIEGLPTDGACPECGRAIAESLPERRTGSPWQRNPSMRSWWSTCVQTITRPRRTFRQLRVEEARSERLLHRHLFIGPLIGMLSLGALIIAVVVAELTRSDRPVHPDYATIFLFIVFLLVTASLLLTIALWMATPLTSLLLHGRAHMRQWRITGTAGEAICAHAAAGFVLGGLLTLPAAQLGVIAALIESERLAVVAAVWFFIASPVIGLAAFIILTAIGARQCRYANRPRPASPTPLPEAPETREVA